MQCKRFRFLDAITRTRVLQVLRFSRISLILLGFALFSLGARANAQEHDLAKCEGIISGTVYLLSNNQPASQVAVGLKSHDSGIFRSVLTDYDGHFEVPGLPSGLYEIVVEEQGYQPLNATAQLDGAALQLELHLVSSTPPPASPDANTVSVRELMIPGKAQEEYRKGLMSLAKREFVQSLSHFTKAIRAFPGYFEALYHLGVAETSLGRRQEAMQNFQAAINVSGGRYAKAQFGIGYIYYLQGDARAAETNIRRGLQIDPNSPDGYVILGMALLRLNRVDEAEKSAREALLRDPNLANAYLVLADSCSRRQDYREQIQDLDTYLRLDPSGPASQRALEVREVAQEILNRMQPKD
ncbi:MAG: hypothetical protein DMG40_05740 [Acidobacteria bacterium]|nr:MAG: hypothetical protein DMG40_05740 [Acidobacteriota bacterium]